MRAGAIHRVTNFVFHLIPHTHWDREWYATRAAFLTRLVPMLDDACATLLATPGLSFLLDGQTVVISDYLAVRPAAREVVAGLVAGGQLHTGPSHVLVDELIPSGESLVRNLLLGRRHAHNLGAQPRTFYSPDAFGHPSSLPMLALQFGLRGIALWRGHAGPRDFFRWQAPDGSALPVYHLPASGYEVGQSLPSDAAMLGAAWPSLRDELIGRAASRHIAIFIGADHHPLRTDLPALASALADLEPANDVRISSLDDFMAATTLELGGGDVVTGELRAGQRHTWSLQGVHSTRLPLKRLNSLTELLLERYAEPLAALAGHNGKLDQRPLLEMAWRLVVETQFHDTICGTVHDEAAEAAAHRLRNAGALGRSVQDRAKQWLGGIPDLPVSVEPGAGSLLLWNPRATQAGGVAVVDVTCFRSDVLIGPPLGRRARHAASAPRAGLALSDGTMLRTQMLGTGQRIERIESAERYPDADRVHLMRMAVLVPPLAGMGLATGHLKVAHQDGVLNSGVTADGRELRNQHLCVSVRADGALDIESRSGVMIRRALELETQADLGDCYTASPRGPVCAMPQPREWRVLASGPLLAAVEGCGAGDDVRYRLRLELRHEEAFLRVRLDLDNSAANQRMRLRVPVGSAPYALAGAAFGYERRRPESSSAPRREKSVATAPAQRFVAIASANAGAVLLAPGHMEYEVRKDGCLLLTVRRSIGELSRAELPERPGHAAWPTPVPGAQCRGRSTVQLALLPCDPKEADDPAAITRAWEAAFLGPHASWYRGRSSAGVAAVGVELVGHGLMVSAVKPADEGPGMILRAVNLLEQEVTGTWRVTPPPTEAWLLRADETRVERLGIEGSAVPFRVSPRALSTVLVA